MAPLRRILTAVVALAGLLALQGRAGHPPRWHFRPPPRKPTLTHPQNRPAKTCHPHHPCDRPPSTNPEVPVAYKMTQEGSLETYIDYASATIAGLEALPETAILAAPFHTLRDQLKAERDARDEDRWTLLGAQRKVAVLDAQWDHAVVDLSGRAWLAAGKKPGAEPYASLFGTVTAKQVTVLGAHKETVIGEKLVAKGHELGHPDLAESLGKLSHANETLHTAAQVRDAADTQALLHEITRRKLKTELERLVAHAEVGILTQFPGRDDLVRAMLAPDRPDRKPEAHAEAVADLMAEPLAPATAR